MLETRFKNTGIEDYLHKPQITADFYLLVTSQVTKLGKLDNFVL